MFVDLRAEAESEFDDAFDYYDARRPGLGSEFATEVQLTFQEIAAGPFVQAQVFADIRRRAVRRFPYIIYYRPHVDRVEVIAVFHTSRDPSVWKGRV